MSEMENASLNQLDAYLEVFYEEDIETKIVATRKILLLTLDIKNMEYLLNHGNLGGGGDTIYVFSLVIRNN
jgi:hypothetical protein